jgi:hypothetical protein
LLSPARVEPAGSGAVQGLVKRAILAGAGALIVTLAWLLHIAPRVVLQERERAWGAHIEEGDLVFQDLDCGERCALIRSVTHSRYSHVGIVLREGDELMVWEALAPVGPTPLVEWVHRGIREELAIYRFRSHVGTAAIAAEVRAMRGLPYDADYQWDDERIYCSELIAKAVNRVLGEHSFEPKPIGSLGAYAERIRKMSGGRLTEATPIVSPLDLVRSPLVTKIVDELSR